MDKRLCAIAEYLRGQHTVADIGTDHALLPIFLIKNGYAQKVIASDINEKPLLKGKENLVKQGVADSVELRLCSGLDGFTSDEFNAAVIAGMGAETIIEILEAGKGVLQNKKLVLNPVSKSNLLLNYLNNGEYRVLNHNAVMSGGRIYEIITVKKENAKKNDDPLFNVLGKLDLLDSAAKKLAVKKRAVIKKMADEIKNVAIKSDEYKKAEELLKLLDERIKNGD